MKPKFKFSPWAACCPIGRMVLAEAFLDFLALAAILASVGRAITRLSPVRRRLACFLTGTVVLVAQEQLAVGKKSNGKSQFQTYCKVITEQISRFPTICWQPL